MGAEKIQRHSENGERIVRRTMDLQKMLGRRRKDSMLMGKMVLKDKNWKLSWSEKQQDPVREIC